MDSADKYKSTIGFIDLLFNILVGFVFLFVIAFMLINPVAKTADIMSPAEFLIVLTWPNDSPDDMDLWTRDPSGNYVGYRSLSAGIMHLERDDLGFINDTIVVAGEYVTIMKNQETIAVRGILPGEYLVSVHYYSKRSEVLTVPVTVEVLKINPHKLIYSQTKEFSTAGQSLNYYKFQVNSDGSARVIGESLESAAPLRF